MRGIMPVALFALALTAPPAEDETVSRIGPGEPGGLVNSNQALKLKLSS